MKDRSCGLTLIELVLVIAIIAILLATVSMNIKPIESTQAKMVLRQIKTDIINTRNEAISQNVETKIEFDNNSYTFSINGMVENIKLPQSVVIKKMTTDYFSFTSNGTPSKAGSILIEIGSKKFVISVEPVNGKVNVKDKNEKV